jgi:methionyl-tRNA formyltransferase
MRVVFMGTPSFAVPALRRTAAEHEVVAVYTRPDAVSGRGRAVRPSPVKEAALELGLAVVQPATLRTDTASDDLRAWEPDVVCVAAYGLILPPAVLSVPVFGCVNVHASLLPRWRGAAPIERAILAGDELAGVSIMLMEEGLDTGPYCAQASLQIGSSNAADLTERLAELGAEELSSALRGIEGRTVVWTPQDESDATYAEKISRSDVALVRGLAAADALRRVRASKDSAPCRVTVAGREVTLLDVRTADLPDPSDDGSVRIDRTGLYLGVADGWIAVERVRPQGKGDMDALSWARGVPELVPGASGVIWSALT